MASKTQVHLPDDFEMVLIRTFDAPRDLVWRAWTDAKQFAQWWGPRAFTVEAKFDLKRGGRYAFVMLGPEDARVPISGVFLEVDTGKRLVMTMDLTEVGQDWMDAYNDARGGEGKPPSITMTVTFEDAPGGATKLTIAQCFASREERDTNVKLGAEAGWSESFDKLDELLVRA